MQLIGYQMFWYVLVVALATAEELESAMTRETLTEEECKTVVKKVIETKSYTEEAILPICKETASSPKCDFFSEALSLASSHPDFSQVVFCKDIMEAHFCSQTMDVILSSPGVGDLMLGECMRRSKEEKGEEGEDRKIEPRPGSEGFQRCLRLQKILSYAVYNDDLDTMRTCYMIQAYGDLEGPKEEGKNESVVPNPDERIIRSSGKKTDDLGEGDAVNRSAVPEKVPPGQAGIVLQPVPLDSLGKGKAIERKVEAAAGEGQEANKTDANETAKEEPIIVEPVERQQLQIAKVNETKKTETQVNETKKTETIITESLPRKELKVETAEVNKTEAPSSPIIVEPIPLKKNESALVIGKIAMSKIPAVALLAKTRPVARHT